MKFAVMLVAIILPCLIESSEEKFSCRMARSFYGGAVHSPSSMEYKTHMIAVDLDKQIAVLWEKQAPFSWDTAGAVPPKHFQLFDYNARKSYTVDKNKECTVETIDAGLTLPVVNPATDPESMSSWGNYAFFKKDNLKLTISKSKCVPKNGNLVQVKWNRPITLRISYYELPITNTRILYPDISMCPK